MMTRVRPHPLWLGYGLGLVFTALVAAAVVLLAGPVGPLAALLFILPVALSAWVGGFGPGALATVLSIAAGAYFLLPPLTPQTWQRSPELAQLSLLAAVLALLTTLVARWRQAESQAASKARLGQALAAFDEELAAAPPTIAGILDAAGLALRSAVGDPFVLKLLSDDEEWLHTHTIYHLEADTLAALREVHAAPERSAEGLSGQVLKTAEPARVIDATPEQLRAGIRPRYWPQLERFAGWHVLAAPLRSRSRVLGILWALREPKQTPFSAAEQEWLQALADRVAWALDAARRVEAGAQARQAAEEEAERARQVQGLAAALAGAQTVEQIARVIADQAWPVLDAASGSLALLDEDQTTLDIVDIGLAPASTVPGTRHLPLSATGPITDAMNSRQAIWLRSTDDLRARYPALPRQQIESWPGASAALPMLVDGHVLGCLLVSRARPVDFDEKARAYLLAVAQQCAHAVHRVRLYWTEVAGRLAAEAGQARLARLQAAARALPAARGLEQTLEAVLAQAMTASAADTGALYLLDEDGTRLELRHSSGYPEFAHRELESLTLDSRAPEAAAARARLPVTLSLSRPVAGLPPQLARAYASLRCEALAAFPLLVEERALGVVTLGFAQTHDLAQTDEDFLRALGMQCGLAVWQAQQYEDEKAARRAAEQGQQRELYLAEISTRLASSLDVRTILDMTARLAVPRLADFSLVLALTAEGAVGGIGHAHTHEKDMPLLANLGQHLSALPEKSRSLAAQVVKSKRLMVVPEVSASMLSALTGDSALREFVHRLAPQALMVVPMLVEDRSVGVLILCTTQAQRRFESESQILAQELARRAARAIDHALRHREAQSLNAELEDRVNKRTEELQATISRLETEIAEREQAQAQLELSREQLRQLSARLQAAREEERARIAREVHDELGQQLTGLKMDIAWLRKKLREQQEPLLKKTRVMAELIDTTVQTVRRITHELRPGLLDDFGLLAAIEWQVGEFQTRTGIDCQLIAYTDEVQLDPESATAIFRVFQETLSNVARHASATRAEVTLEKQGNDLVLQVEDNGRGITQKELYGAKSLGILGMRERIHLLSGELEIRGVPNEGTTVLVRVPLPTIVREDSESGVPRATSDSGGNTVESPTFVDGSRRS